MFFYERSEFKSFLEEICFVKMIKIKREIVYVTRGWKFIKDRRAYIEIEKKKIKVKNDN
jgi:hypothetical protein